MCGPSLRKIGKGVFELSIGNKKVTEGQRDKAICPLFMEGGHKKTLLISKYELIYLKAWGGAFLPKLHSS